MKTWTVVGVFEDNGTTYSNWYDADDEHAAMAACAAECSGELLIIGAIEGRHDLMPPCEDSGKSAYAVDLQEDDEDDEEQPEAGQ